MYINNNNNIINNNFVIPQYKTPKIQYLSIILIIIMMFQISYGFTILYLFQSNHSYLIKIPISLIFYLSSIMSIISYICTIKTDNKIDYEYFSHLSIENCTNLSYCNKCQCYRSLRSHHCSDCNVCISLMDHHCIWMANCIGEKNLKSFYLFIIYSFISCFICLLFTYKIFFDLNGGNYNNINLEMFLKENFIERLFGNFVRNLPLFTFFLSGFFSLSLGIFIYIHYCNLKIGLTTVEKMIYSKNLKECPDYNENFIQNIENVFKDNIFLPFNKNDIEKINLDNKEETEYLKLN